MDDIINDLNYNNIKKELNDDLIFYKKIDDIIWDGEITILKENFNITKEEYEKFLIEIYNEWKRMEPKEKKIKYKELLEEIDKNLKEIEKIKVE